MSERQPIETGAALFGRLLAMSRTAHARGQHAVAYHALAAAMHAADDAGDLDALAEVGREAAAQIAWIDRFEPEIRLSTSSARRHDHPGVYAMLGRQAAAHEKMAAPRQPVPPEPPPGSASAGQHEPG